MTKVYAFVLALLILTLTSATAWGQTSGGPETVLIHSGSATLHAMLWRPQGRGPFPGILLNHGSGRPAKIWNASDRTNKMPKNSVQSSLAMAMYSYTCFDAGSGFPRIGVPTLST
jgi:hypothetical protein